VRDFKKMVAEIARVVAVGGSFVSISCRWERQETHGPLTSADPPPPRAAERRPAQQQHAPAVRVRLPRAARPLSLP
jgi:hypothetical protein